MNKVSKISEKAYQEGRKNLLEPEAKTICMEYGIPVTKFKVAKNEGEAAKFAEEIGYPVVLKVVSPHIIHKSDVGGVFLNLKDAEGVRLAFNKIVSSVESKQTDAKVIGVLVEEMASPSTEVIIGMARMPG